MTVTHPFHPLCGQQVEVLFLRRGAAPDLIVRLPDGEHAAIALGDTDYTTPGCGVLPAPAVPLLDLYGLWQAAQFIASRSAPGDAARSPNSGGAPCRD